MRKAIRRYKRTLVEIHWQKKGASNIKTENSQTLSVAPKPRKSITRDNQPHNYTTPTGLYFFLLSCMTQTIWPLIGIGLWCDFCFC